MPQSTHFKKFGDHTEPKHLLLGAYLKRWATILISAHNPAVHFVDGFAGAGSDDEGNAGSPVVAAKIAADINAASEPAFMRVVAIEANQARYRALVTALAPFSEQQPKRTDTYRGKLEAHIDRL